MTDQSQPDPPENGKPETSTSILRSYSDPIVAITLLILIGVFALIGFSMFDKDGGLLGRMAEPSFARGLITYLFAAVTMGVAIVLVVSALNCGTSETDGKKFQRGKEVLSLLLGVFGTIIGFYFGSEFAEIRPTAAEGMFLARPLLSDSTVTAGKMFTITANVRGGTPPYRFGVAYGMDSRVEHAETVRDDGWIIKELAAPDSDRAKTVLLKLGVIDANGESELTATDLRVTPAIK